MMGIYDAAAEPETQRLAVHTIALPPAGRFAGAWNVDGQWLALLSLPAAMELVGHHSLRGAVRKIAAPLPAEPPPFGFFDGIVTQWQFDLALARSKRCAERCRLHLDNLLLLHGPDATAGRVIVCLRNQAGGM